MIMTKLVRAALMLMLLSLAACSAPSRLAAVPVELTEQAEVIGVPGVRYLVGYEMPEFTKEALDSFAREQRLLASQGYKGELPPVNFLAISGGGDNGAYGAGMLCGWTEKGNRPQFKAVTGISTGALIAPFAFIGAKYDFVLKKVYTEISPDDILEHRNVFSALFDDALADNEPLRQLIQQYITQDFLHEITQEYQKGRLLLVSTTNLDARRAVIWNMGKIAASATPQSLKLFQDILLASAAIPGAFPPAMVDVEAQGQHYQEMHVDGGAMAQVFLYPPALKLGEMSKQKKVVRERNLYVIRNARLDPQWAEVERSTMTIAGRAIQSLIQTQSIGDLYQIYTETQRDGINFNLAYIPKTFNAPHNEEFDTQYMRQLFQIGYDRAINGFNWDTKPPGL
jgi:predicted patatin/cPLA2 family phospholipase